jgi:uncharacterized protein (DUF362 family)
MMDTRMKVLATDPAVAPELRSRVALIRGLGERTARRRLRTPIHTLLPIRRSGEPAPELVRGIHEAVELSTGWRNVVRAGDRVLLKPNFNSGDPPPNSTDIPLLVTLIRLLYDYGAGRVIVGEGSRHPPTSTRFELRRAGVFEACKRAGAEVEVFGDSGWVPVSTRGHLLRWIEAARPLVECDRLVFACCLKTHWLTRFSISLKHTVGCIRPRHRARLHFGGHIEERVAEIASAFRPDLVVVDGRQAYSSGGPCYGFVCDPGVLIAGTDRVAVDVTGIRCLQSLPGCSLSREARQYAQIKHAIELGLGTGDDERIDLVERRALDK